MSERHPPRNVGYRVLTAESGPQALEVLAQHPETRLLFTDVVMQGGMTGGELIMKPSALAALGNKVRDILDR